MLQAIEGCWSVMKLTLHITEQRLSSWEKARVCASWIDVLELTPPDVNDLALALDDKTIIVSSLLETSDSLKNAMSARKTVLARTARSLYFSRALQVSVYTVVKASHVARL